LAELVHSCLRKDYKKRPSIETILLLDVVQNKATYLKLKLPIKKEIIIDTTIKLPCAIIPVGDVNNSLNRSLT